jgi:hypothetical protein
MRFSLGRLPDCNASAPEDHLPLSVGDFSALGIVMGYTVLDGLSVGSKLLVAAVA